MNRSIVSTLRAAACGCLLAGLFGTVAMAAEPVWINLAIPDFGASVSLPAAAIQPDKNTEYKVVFNLIGEGPNEKINPSLERVARAVNIFASAGVPLSHLHFVAVIHGPATQSVLDNDHYKEKFNVDNLNVKLIAELKSAGVKVRDHLSQRFFSDSALDQAGTAHEVLAFIKDCSVREND